MPAPEPYSNVPRELLALPWWMFCQGKVPCSPRDGTRTGWNEPGRQGTFEEAYKWVGKPHVDGVGIVIPKHFPANIITAWDFDHVIESENGRLIKWVGPPEWQIFFEQLQLETYCEISTSGTGIRAFTSGSLPLWWEDMELGEFRLEAWDHDRFVIVTGRQCSQAALITGAPRALSLLPRSRPEAPKPPPEERIPDPTRYSEAVQLLAQLDPDMKEPWWWRIAQCLGDELGVQLGKQVFSHWSKGLFQGRPSAKYSQTRIDEIFARTRPGGGLGFGTLVRMVEGEAKEAGEDAVYPTSLVYPGDVLEEEPPTIDYVIEPYFPEGQLIEVHGAHGAYKSTVLLWATLAMACGEPWHDQATTKGGKTAFLTREDDYKVILSRLHAFIKRPFATDEEQRRRSRSIQENFGYLAWDEMRNLFLVKKERYGSTGINVGALQVVTKLCEDRKLVVIETASRLSEGHEDPEALTHLALALERVAKETGACVVLIRHVSKAQAREGDIDSYGGRGSGTLADAARGVLTFDVNREVALPPIRVVHTKSYSLGRKGDDLVWHPDEGPFGIYLSSVKKEDVAKAEVKVADDLLARAKLEVVRILRRAPGPMLLSTIKDGKATKPVKPFVREALECLKSEGVVEGSERSRWSLVHRVDSGLPNPESG